MNNLDCPVSIYSCTDNTPIYTENVFACDNNDRPIKYNPYGGNRHMGKPTEDMFHQKCDNRMNTFFYPRDATQFFKKDDNINTERYRHPCLDIPYYNKAWNQAHESGLPKLLSNACGDPNHFFKEGSDRIYPNQCMKSGLTRVDKYISAYHDRVNRHSCDELPCDLSFSDSAAI